MPAEVQDALVTVLSEKTLPVPELDTEIAGRAGLQPDRHRQRPRPRHQRAVERPAPPVQHRRPAAAGRPPTRRSPSSAVASRELGAALSLPDVPAADDEIRRVVTDLPRAARRRHRRRPHQPQGPDRHAVDRRGDLGGHQRPRPRRPLRRRAPRRRPTSPAASSVPWSTIPVTTSVAWREYLEAVVRDRAGWGDFYDACRASTVSGGRDDRRHRSCGAPARRPPPRSRLGPRRSCSALDALQPAAVLVELPADCEPALRWIGDADLVPPVALLGYVVAEPAAGRVRAVRRVQPGVAGDRVGQRTRRAGAGDRPAAAPYARREHRRDDELVGRADATGDPLGDLAAAAGDPDPERWWEDVIEHRGDGPAGVRRRRRGDGRRPRRLRADAAAKLQREAHMRRAIRAAADGSDGPIAVVCGAWHVPALDRRWSDGVQASDDAATLRGLPEGEGRRDVGAVDPSPAQPRPRGYGAGVSSPGLVRATSSPTPAPPAWRRFFVEIAAAAARAAAAGIARRPDRRHPRWPTRSPPCADVRGPVWRGARRRRRGDGRASPSYRRELVVGDAIGAVPPTAPQVPLARDLRGCSSPPASSPSRGADDDRARPAHPERASTLDPAPPSAAPSACRGARWRKGAARSGTFRETWRLAWEPELSIRLIERAGYGTTRRGGGHGAAPRARRRRRAPRRPGRGCSTGRCSPTCPTRSRRSSTASPGGRRSTPTSASVMDALGPLGTALRYGDVRGTDAGVAAGACSTASSCASSPAWSTGLPSLDDDAAAPDGRAPRAACRPRWPSSTTRPAERAGRRVLAAIADRPACTGWSPGGPPGCCTTAATGAPTRSERRLPRALSPGHTGRRRARRSSRASSPAAARCCVHDAELLGVVDAGWRRSPATRSTPPSPCCAARSAPSSPPSGASSGAARRRADRVRSATFGDDVDAERAAAALVTVRHLLGAARRRRRAGWNGGARDPSPRVSEPSGCGAGGSCSAKAGGRSGRRDRATGGGCRRRTTVAMRPATARRSAATIVASTPRSARSTTRERDGGRPRCRRPGGLGRSAPSVARWLGDIRRYFPTPVVQVLQRDAVERLDLRQLLLEPEMLAAGRARPAPRHAARRAEPAAARRDPGDGPPGDRQRASPTCRRRLTDRTRQAVRGALARAGAHRPPRARRHRLAAHDPRQPAQLGARAAHVWSPNGCRLRPPPARASPATSSSPSTSRGSMADSVVYAVAVRRGAGPAADAAHAVRRLRHRGRRSDAVPARPRRGAVRRPARRRHRHRPGAGLLPRADHQPRRVGAVPRVTISTRAATRR